MSGTRPGIRATYRPDLQAVHLSHLDLDMVDMVELVEPVWLPETILAWQRC